MKNWVLSTAHRASPADLAALGRIRKDGGLVLTREDDGPGQRVISLAPEHSPLAIGRRPSMDVVLAADRAVSRLHAELRCVAGEWVLLDDGLSKNGSFVNGAKVGGRRRLVDGDELRFGRTRFTCHHTRSGTPVGSLTLAQRLLLREMARPLGDDPLDAPATDTEIARALGVTAGAVQREITLLCAQFAIDASDGLRARTQLLDAVASADTAGPATT